MKRTIVFISFLLSILFVGSAFKNPQNDDPKENINVEMLQNLKGKIIKIDTVLVKAKLDSLDELTGNLIKVLVEKADGDSITKEIVIYLDGKGRGKSLCKTLSSGDIADLQNMKISSLCDNDSLCANVFVTADSDGKTDIKKIMVWNSDDSYEEIPVHVFTSGKSHLKTVKEADDVTVIRLDDPSIISFKKKDIGGGKEKIEIVREKQ